MSEPRLVPPQTKGHVSVARLSRFWYVACRAEELSDRPLARTVLGIPLVLFRDGSGSPAALLDRCPHRNVPLSLGRLVSGRIECAYHGWQLDGAGVCRHVPGLLSDDGKERRTACHPVREQDGFVWVWADPSVRPDHEPFAMPLTNAAGYTTLVREVEAEGTLHATIENALDVPHTSFLHRGLFRGTGERNTITAIVRRSAGGVEAEYQGEPRPTGLAARVLSPSGGLVQHWDRFFLPSIAQVEYKLGTENHFMVTSACTPVEDFRTRLFAVVSFRSRIPGALLAPVLEPLAMRIFRQDAEILKHQTDSVRRFGGEQFMSTEIDVLGPHIWRLMRQAERGERPEEGIEAAVQLSV